MKKLAIFALLLFAAPALAQQTCPPTGGIASDAALLCWVNATEDVNGNPLPATGPFSLTQTRIQRSTGATCQTTFGTAVETLNVTPDVKMVLFENLPAGRWCYRARHVSRDAASVELLSDWSAVATKIAAAPTPPPAKSKPTTITIF